MTTKTSLKPPTDDLSPPTGLLLRIATAVEAIAAALTKPKITPEIQCFTAEQAADALGVSKWWVLEHMDAQDIPFTYVGKHRRMTAEHIRKVLVANEVDPNRRGRRKSLTAA